MQQNGPSSLYVWSHFLFISNFAFWVNILKLKKWDDKKLHIVYFSKKVFLHQKSLKHIFHATFSFEISKLMVNHCCWLILT